MLAFENENIPSYILAVVEAVTASNMIVYCSQVALNVSLKAITEYCIVN